MYDKIKIISIDASKLIEKYMHFLIFFFDFFNKMINLSGEIVSDIVKSMLESKEECYENTGTQLR